jgi:hypothetical protein
MKLLAWIMLVLQVVAEAWSVCLSLVPLTLPLALLWGVLLWHLIALDGYMVEELNVIRGPCLVSWGVKVVGKELPVGGGGGCPVRPSRRGDRPLAGRSHDGRGGGA